MFGLETEYAFSAFGRNGAKADQDRAIGHFMDLARRTLVHLPDHNSQGMFLQNGSRFYVDCGRHPEMATCEVVNPWDACRYVLAGEQILSALAEQVVAEDRMLREIFLTRCNVSYSPGRPTTWGCHESYGHRIPPARLRDQIIPHLISRIIYTGAGGFDNRCPGIQFTVSPRVAHLEHVASDSSTGSRGIYHNKDESLCRNGSHRLHVLCGESVCSQTSLWLKTGVTALVVAMIEAGLEPCAAIRLRDPLAAMKRFATGVAPAATAESLDGRLWTAVAVQRHILQQIEAHADHPIMPPWTTRVCQRLHEVLDGLEQGPQAVAKTLDWAIKLALCQELAHRRGFAWESLDYWNGILARRHRRRTPAEPAGQARSALRMLLESAVAAEDVTSAGSLPEEPGVDRDQLRAVLALRQDLFELDTRFGQLGPRGVFATLDRAGVLQHAVPGVDNVEHAVANPPATGRAHLRGECVRRFHHQRDRFACDWMAVWDRQQNKYLDLSEPFASREHWCDAQQEQPQPSSSILDVLQRMLADAQRSYQQGRYEQANQVLEHMRSLQECLPPQNRLAWLRLRSWVQCRRGYFDGRSILDGLGREHSSTLWLTMDYLSIYRFGGLIPRPEAARYVQAAGDLLQHHPAQTPDQIVYFQEHRGYFLMTEGRLEEARESLQSACDASRRAVIDARVACRAMAVLGEVHRRLGHRAEAARWLESAMMEQTAHEFLGERAGFSWTYLAKLMAGSPIARHILGQAKAIQRDFQDRMGEARTLLLDARLMADNRSAEPLRRQLLNFKEQIPALAQCRLLTKVLDRWDTWTDGRLAPDESGDIFWGV
jgi:hypothetical protein